jgi:hypothetical protein
MATDEIAVEIMLLEYRAALRRADDARIANDHHLVDRQFGKLEGLALALGAVGFAGPLPKFEEVR